MHAVAAVIVATGFLAMIAEGFLTTRIDRSGRRWTAPFRYLVAVKSRDWDAALFTCGAGLLTAGFVGYHHPWVLFAALPLWAWAAWLARPGKAPGVESYEEAPTGNVHRLP